VPTPARQLCALLHDGRVITDAARRVPSYDEGDQHTPLAERAATCGDPGAVLIAPHLQVHEDPMVLLSVFAPRGEPVDGIWTPLDDLAEDDDVVTALRSVAAVADGSVETPERRPDWFRLSWYDDVERWVDAELAARGRPSRTGPVEPVKVWSLSAALRVPCDPGPPVWLKAACPHFHAEPALTRLVAEMDPEHAPRPIALDEHRAWLLMEHFPGADDDRAPGPAAARVAATLHLRALDHLAEVEAAGVPVRDLATTLRQFDEVLEAGVELDQLSADELAAARATRGEVHAVLEELAGLGIPHTLVHGDLHIGNVAHQGDSLVLYDWSDAAVSHPFLDVDLLAERLEEEEQHETRAAYAEVWRAACPGADVDRALALAGPAKVIYQTVTFEQIYRAQEDASYWEMRGIVARYLRGLPERFGERR
jgi:aminoglycoside phosphotransferase (APT) family kinase protein